MKESKIQIVSTRVGYSNSILLVNGSNSAIIDTGVKGQINVFKLLLKKFLLEPSDIKLIILTHTHYDHTGNLKALVDLCGAKVLVHKNEFENLKNGFTPIPIGQGKYSRIISKLGRMIYPSFASPKPFIADFVNEHKFDLKAFGINGKLTTQAIEKLNLTPEEVASLTNLLTTVKEQVTADFVSRTKLTENLPVRLARNIGQHIEAAAVGHTNHNFLYTFGTSLLNQLIHGRNEAFTTF